MYWLGAIIPYDGDYGYDYVDDDDDVYDGGSDDAGGGGGILR